MLVPISSAILVRILFIYKCMKIPLQIIAICRHLEGKYRLKILIKYLRPFDWYFYTWKQIWTDINKVFSFSRNLSWTAYAESHQLPRDQLACLWIIYTLWILPLHFSPHACLLTTSQLLEDIKELLKCKTPEKKVWVCYCMLSRIALSLVG